MSDKGRDPEFRAIRRTLQGVHMVVAVGFGLMLALGVWRGLDEIRPERPIAPEGYAACVDAAESLRRGLIERLASFPEAVSATEEGLAFEQWSVSFRARLNEARERCRMPTGACAAQREAIAEAFATVTRALNLSAISATHWARHLGPSLDDSAEAIRAARAAE